MIVSKPGASHPVTIRTMKALTCFFFRPVAGNPSHPLCGWLLTRWWLQRLSKMIQKDRMKCVATMPDGFSIGYESLETGLAIHAIRSWDGRYQKQRLRLKACGRRFFSQSDIDRLHPLKQLLEYGQSLSTIFPISGRILTKNRQRLLQIPDQIVRVLNAGRISHQAFGYAHVGPFLAGTFHVAGSGGRSDNGFYGS